MRLPKTKKRPVEKETPSPSFHKKKLIMMYDFKIKKSLKEFADFATI